MEQATKSQQATKPQQASTVSSQNTKPYQNAQNYKPRQNTQQPQKDHQAGRPYKAGVATGNYQHDQDERSFYKPVIYDPDLFHLNFESDKASGKKADFFKGYVQVPISKLDEKWKKDSTMFFKTGDLIKYKCTTLSITAMKPVLSDWREGKIESIVKNKVMVLRSDIPPKEEGEKEPVEEDEEESEEETEEDEFFLHTLNSIYISEASLDQERKNAIQGLVEEEQKLEVKQKENFAEKKKQLQEELQKQLKKSEDDAIKDEKDYKKRMIGKQVTNINRCIMINSID